MKKLALVALFTIVSVTNLHAFKIKIDNDTDGAEATIVRVELYSGDIRIRAFALKADKEKSVKFKLRPQSPLVTGVKVFGLKGAGRDQIAHFLIPQYRLNKDIKVDINMENGRLQLSLDK